MIANADWLFKYCVWYKKARLPTRGQAADRVAVGLGLPLTAAGKCRGLGPCCPGTPSSGQTGDWGFVSWKPDTSAGVDNLRLASGRVSAGKLRVALVSAHSPGILRRSGTSRRSAVFHCIHVLHCVHGSARLTSGISRRSGTSRRSAVFHCIHPRSILSAWNTSILGNRLLSSLRIRADLFRGRKPPMLSTRNTSVPESALLGARE